MATVRKTLREIKATQPKLTDAQRQRLESMSDAEIEYNAAHDSETPALSSAALERAVTARRIRRTREKLNLSQDQFAKMFHIPVATLRDWEQARRKPDAPALAYLTVIDKNPDAVTQALS